MKGTIVWVFVLLAPMSMCCFAENLIEIDLAANDIALNSQTGMLYAAVPSSAGFPYGNSLVEISPIDGSIVRSVFVGSEPAAIGMSPDSAVAYVGLSGAPLVYPVDLTSMTVGTYFSLGTTTFDGPRYADQIVVMAGSPNTVAISRRNHCCSPRFEGIAIYDSGVMRATVDANAFGGGPITFGSQTNTLYSYDNESTAFALQRLTVDASGVTVATSASDVIQGFNVRIISRGDTIFATDGSMVDGTQMLLLGTYTLPSPGFGQAVVVDDATSTVVFAEFGELYAYDRDTFLPINSVSIPSSNAVAATNCGRPACVVFAYDSGEIFIVPDVRTIFSNGFE